MNDSKHVVRLMWSGGGGAVTHSTQRRKALLDERVTSVYITWCESERPMKGKDKESPTCWRGDVDAGGQRAG